jgi:predicted amidohydrolase
VARARAIAAAQTTPLRGDVDANLAQHVRLAEIAAEERARVLVFPELSLTGYELDLARDLAFSPRDPRLDPLVDLAAARSMTLIVGAPLRRGPLLHLGAFIVSPDRSVDVYTKHFLGAFPPSASPDGIVPPPEASVFRPGDRNPLVRFDDDVGAVAVCADTGRASHAKAAAERGATTYLASMFVIPADLEKDTANLRTYAARHAMAVVFANFGGPSGGLPSAGASAIWSERGELLATLGTAGAGVAVALETDAGWRAKTVVPEDI